MKYFRSIKKIFFFINNFFEINFIVFLPIDFQ